MNAQRIPQIGVGEIPPAAFRLSSIEQGLFHLHVPHAIEVRILLTVRSIVGLHQRKPLCMGSLYWQFNDVWPAVSWSSIEYSGTWKLLHYAAKRLFDPVHLSLYIKEDHVQVWGINDRDKTFSGTLILEYMDFQGKVLERKESDMRLYGEAAT